MDLTLADYIRRVEAGELQPSTIVEHYKEKAHNDSLNARVRLHDDYVEAHREDFSNTTLHAAPIGIKDNILTEGYETTCSSKMLEGYIPPYSATCFTNLEKAGGLMLGKTNMDEFAMGASTENSALGITKHPLDETRVPGGSSGGSAAAVAADQCLAALGTETGGSVRQPAALCGLVGVKPTYGRVSRYGVQAMAASINQVGVVTKTVEDSMILLDAIAGHDSRDAKSIDRGNEQQTRYAHLEQVTLQGMKFALPKQFLSEGLDPRIKAVCMATIDKLKVQGVTVEEVDIPILSYVVPIYYIMVPAEVSGDLARFDGIRFGLQDDTMQYDNIFNYYEHIRHDGLGDEVKRRVIVGSYVLSSGFYDAYYHQAQLAKQKMIRDLAKIYKDFDAIIGPTTPSLAWKIGEKVHDPIQMYLEDIYTAVANVTGLPAISVPVGTATDDGVELPVGMQVMPTWRGEGTMFGIAHQIERMIQS